MVGSRLALISTVVKKPCPQGRTAPCLVLTLFSQDMHECKWLLFMRLDKRAMNAVLKASSDQPKGLARSVMHKKGQILQ